MQVTRFYSHWFNRKISTITKQDVQKLYEKIGGENGFYQANWLLE